MGATIRNTDIGEGLYSKQGQILGISYNKIIFELWLHWFRYGCGTRAI